MLQPIATDSATAEVTLASFAATSGFVYQVNAKQIEQIKIYEAVGAGTGVKYLCGLQIYDLEGTLLAESTYQDLRYTRDTVRQLAGGLLHKAIADFLARKGEKIDGNALQAKINTLLDTAYYAEADAAMHQLLTKWNLL